MKLFPHKFFVIIKTHWLPTSPLLLTSYNQTHTHILTRTHNLSLKHTLFYLRALNSTLEEERIKLQTDLTAARLELKRKTSDKIPDKGLESATKHAPLEGYHLGLNAGSEEKEEDDDSKGLLVRKKYFSYFTSLTPQQHN